MNEKQSLKLAETISLLTNPAILLVAAAGFIIYRYSEGLTQFFYWMVIAVSLLLLPGVIYSISTWVKEKRFDIDITQREDRIVPLMLATLGALIGGYMVTNRLDSINLQFISNVLVAFLLAITVITFIWKISLHTSTLAAMVTMLVLFSGPKFGWVFLLLIPVIWSRLKLKQHSPAQLLVGAGLGVAVILTAYRFFSGS